jgi:hypothetical protein
MMATPTRKLSATSTLVILLIGSATASAGLVGSTASFKYVYQLTATDDVMEIPVATIVVSDTEVEIPQLPAILPPAPSSSVDIGDDFFEQKFFEDGGFDIAHQNLGVVTFDQDPPLIITSASLAASNTVALPPSAISFSGNQLFFDVSSGPTYAPNDVLRFDIATTTVPEPSSLALAGLAILPVMIRHRRERRRLLR